MDRLRPDGTAHEVAGTGFGTLFRDHGTVPRQVLYRGSVHLLRPYSLQPEGVAPAALPQVGQLAGRVLHGCRGRGDAHEDADVEVDAEGQQRRDAAAVPVEMWAGMNMCSSRCGECGVYAKVEVDAEGQQRRDAAAVAAVVWACVNMCGECVWSRASDLKAKEGQQRHK